MGKLGSIGLLSAVVRALESNRCVATDTRRLQSAKRLFAIALFPMLPDFPHCT